MSEPRPDTSRVTVFFNPAQLKRLKRLKTMLGESTLLGAAQVATMHGIDRLMVDVPLKGPGHAKVHHRIPAPLWASLQNMARSNSRSSNDEVIAALAHWVEAAETKKGGAPA